MTVRTAFVERSIFIGALLPSMVLRRRPAATAISYLNAGMTSRVRMARLFFTRSAGMRPPAPSSATMPSRVSSSFNRPSRSIRPAALPNATRSARICSYESPASRSTRACSRSAGPAPVRPTAALLQVGLAAEVERDAVERLLERGLFGGGGIDRNAQVDVAAAGVAGVAPGFAVGAHVVAQGRDVHAAKPHEDRQPHLADPGERLLRRCRHAERG